MENIEYVLDSQLRNMLSKYPDQKELSVILIQEIAELFREDFDAIAQKKKRVKIVFDGVISILEIARDQNVKKQYAVDLLGIFLDRDVVGYIHRILEEKADFCLCSIKTAQYELHCSQWSDPTSNHWQRVINRFQNS